MQADRRGQAAAAVSRAQDQHQQMVEILAMVQTLNRLFVELDVLVVQQQTTIDRIADTVAETNVHVEEGVKELGGAIESAKGRNRKKRWCVLIISMSPHPNFSPLFSSTTMRLDVV